LTSLVENQYCKTGREKGQYYILAPDIKNRIRTLRDCLRDNEGSFLRDMIEEIRSSRSGLEKKHNRGAARKDIRK